MTFPSQYVPSTLEDSGNDARLFGNQYLDTREAGERLGLKSFDTALPVQWLNDVHDKTGIWPQNLGVVWCYDNGSIFGYPEPVTVAAWVLVTCYNAMTARHDS